MKNNSVGNARLDRSYRFYSDSQDSRRVDQNKRSLGSFRGQPQCAYCGDMGHFVEKCYQLHGYPPGHPKARIGSIFNSIRILLWLIKFLMVQTKMMGNQW